MSIPVALQKETRWVAWQLDASGKKPPVDAAGRDLPAWQKPKSWLSLEDATKRAAGLGPRQHGVGFVLGSGFAGLDLDDCRDPKTGVLDPRAKAVIALAEGAYAEVSPSGKGVKVFGRGDRWLELTFRDGSVDVDLKTMGYFCVTGEEYRAGDIVDLPLDTVFTHFTSSPSLSSKAKAVVEPLPDIVRPGAQNRELFKEACRHARDGKSEGEIFAIVKAVGEARCPPDPGSPPWVDQDFRAIARSASRYAPSPDPYPTTESGDGEIFAALHSDSVRFDYRRKRWLRFDGTRWAPQEAGEVERLALETIRVRAAVARASNESDPENWQARLMWAKSGESAARRAHMLELAKKEPPIADPGSDWDVNHWTLGVRNGVVDLLTGELRAGRPDDRITMQTSVAFDPSAKCPLWDATVADVLKDNLELIPYIHRALGYSLTGSCSEEVFFLLTGDGRNGKGTLVNTVAAIIGDYSADLAFHSLERPREGDKTTNDLAKLVGKRMVTASETGGGRFNESRLKAMTGRDPITARFLFAEEFTFIPTFKLWLSVNQLPKVHDNSTGFWSRPHRLPFLQCYDGRENRNLKDDLIEEGAGILAWLVRGCVAWQVAGLEAPGVVTTAVADYRESQTPLADFYRDVVVFTKDAHASGSDLRAAYSRWCDERHIYGDRRLGPQLFARGLVEKVGAPTKTRNGTVYEGIGLTAPGEEL